MTEPVSKADVRKVEMKLSACRESLAAAERVIALQDERIERLENALDGAWEWNARVRRDEARSRLFELWGQQPVFIARPQAANDGAP